MWPINYLWTTSYPQDLGNMSVKFPLDLSSCSGEEDFKMFVLQNIIAAKPYDSWHHSWRTFCSFFRRAYPVEFCLDLFSHYREDFWMFYVEINMTASHSIWHQLNICEQPGIAKVLGTCTWSFPSICQAILETKVLKCLFFKKIIAAKPCDMWHHRWRTFFPPG